MVAGAREGRVKQSWEPERLGHQTRRGMMAEADAWGLGAGSYGGCGKPEEDDLGQGKKKQGPVYTWELLLGG